MQSCKIMHEGVAHAPSRQQRSDWTLYNDRRLRRFTVVCLLFSICIGLVFWKFWPAGGNAELKVVFSHFENVPGGKVAVFQVSNTGKRSVTMFGPGAYWPQWSIAWYDGTNWNYDYSPSMDFRDTAPMVLPPGAKATMPTIVPESLERWIVGAQYSTAPYAPLLLRPVRGIGTVEDVVKKRMRVAWSKPITPYSEPSNIVPPLGADTNRINLNTGAPQGSPGTAGTN